MRTIPSLLASANSGPTLNPPCPSSPWDDPDRARLALKTTHNDGEVLDAVAEFLCSYRGHEDAAELVKRLEAIGDSAMDDYLNVIREAA